MKCRRRKNWLMCGVVFFLFAALSLPTQAQAETVLRIKMNGDLKQIDPIWTTSFPVRDMAYLVWDTLFAMDKDFKVQPQMVGDYSISDDRKVYTLTLREGLAWHDGAPVTSEDCIASLDRWMQRDSLGKELKSHLARMEAVDTRTFKLVLNEPWGLTLDALGKPSSNVPFMMPKRLAETAPDKAITDPIGSGPFIMKVDEWVPGCKAVYVKNEKYVPRSEPTSFMAGAKVAAVDRIERITFSDDVSALNALIAGEIDYAEGLPGDMLQLIAKSDNAKLFFQDPLGRSLQVVLNHTQPPLDDIRVRQAIQLALKQTDFMQALFGEQTEFYKICPAIFFCGTPLETDVNSERVMTQDFEKARQLLDEAEYDDTPILVIHPTDIRDADIPATVLVQSLRKAGFVVDDFVTYLATMFSRRTNRGSIAEGGWHIFTTGWGGIDQMSPATNVYVTGKCDEAWFGWPCDQKLQDLRADYFAASTAEQHKEIAKKIQARVHEIVAFIPMGQISVPVGISKKLKGIQKGAVPTFWNVTKTD